jgi:DNA-binding PadR family transcriptional regulator
LTDSQQIERLIIRDLYLSAVGLHPFTFYRRYRITPDHIVEVLNRLEEQGLAYYDQTRIKLTPTGKKWVVDNRALLLKVPDKPWREIPNEFTAPQLLINEPYTPNTSLLSDELLPDGWKKDSS